MQGTTINVGLSFSVGGTTPRFTSLQVAKDLQSQAIYVNKNNLKRSGCILEEEGASVDVQEVIVNILLQI